MDESRLFKYILLTIISVLATTGVMIYLSLERLIKLMGFPI